MNTQACPNCGSARSYTFHRVAQVPVNSCLLFADATRAREVQLGDIALAFCPDCTFIFNAAWTPDRTVYSDQYEETQGFSPTFKAFHQHLAEDLIARYHLSGKEIVEIGCGKGEFLSMLCEMGGNKGVGYDPSFIPERNARNDGMVVHREFFSEATVQPAPDLVCCKMTLEHVFDTKRFVQAVRRIASPQRGTVVFFQVPDVRRILAEGAFWDVYYEHCCYFSESSLRHLFRSCNFEVLHVDTGYDDQYLTIEARPTDASPAAPSSSEAAAMEQALAVAQFANMATASAADWSSRITQLSATGGRTVIWGSGSKAVAFLAATGAGEQIKYLVDINPHRQGKFVPGTGMEIVAPDFLSAYQPDMVIAMNPIYREEIARDLDRLDCNTTLLTWVGGLKQMPKGSGVAIPSEELSQHPAA